MCKFIEYSMQILEINFLAKNYLLLLNLTRLGQFILYEDAFGLHLLIEMKLKQWLNEFDSNHSEKLIPFTTMRFNFRDCANFEWKLAEMFYLSCIKTRLCRKCPIYLSGYCQTNYKKNGILNKFSVVEKFAIDIE